MEGLELLLTVSFLIPRDPHPEGTQSWLGMSDKSVAFTALGHRRPHSTRVQSTGFDCQGSNPGQLRSLEEDSTLFMSQFPPL